MKFTRTELLLLLILASIQFSHIVDFMILMPLGPLLMRSLDIGPKGFGLLVSCYTLAAGLSGLAASFYIDYFDRKKILIAFFIGFIMGTFACAWSEQYSALLVARSITGVFGGVLTSIILSIISDSFEYSRRGMAIGTVMAAFALASVLGVPFGLYLANLHTWQAPFWVLGLTSCCLLVSAMLFVPHQRQHLERTGPRDPWQVFKTIKKDPNQQLALSLIFFLILGQFTVIPYISPSFVSNAGLNEAKLPLLYLLGGICSIFAAPIAGKLSDVYGKTNVFRASILLSLISIYLITNLETSPLWKILIISCSFFIFMSGRMVPSMALITATASTENRAGFLSVVSAIQQLSSAVASWVAGQIIYEGANGVLENYDYAGYIAIASSLFTFFVVVKVKSTYET